MDTPPPAPPLFDDDDDDDGGDDQSAPPPPQAKKKQWAKIVIPVAEEKETPVDRSLPAADVDKLDWSTCVAIQASPSSPNTTFVQLASGLVVLKRSHGASELWGNLLAIRLGVRAPACRLICDASELAAVEQAIVRSNYRKGLQSVTKMPIGTLMVSQFVLDACKEMVITSTGMADLAVIVLYDLLTQNMDRLPLFGEDASVAVWKKAGLFAREFEGGPIFGNFGNLVFRADGAIFAIDQQGGVILDPLYEDWLRDYHRDFAANGAQSVLVKNALSSFERVGARFELQGATQVTSPAAAMHHALAAAMAKMAAVPVSALEAAERAVRQLKLPDVNDKFIDLLCALPVLCGRISALTGRQECSAQVQERKEWMAKKLPQAASAAVSVHATTSAATGAEPRRARSMWNWAAQFGNAIGTQGTTGSK